jgi:DNA-binding NarL/FixJ family response regulator
MVARCADRSTLIEAIWTLRPNIAILDISMRGIGRREIHSIANARMHVREATRVVLFAATAQDGELIALTVAGAYGFITKKTPSSKFGVVGIG